MNLTFKYSKEIDSLTFDINTQNKEPIEIIFTNCSEKVRDISYLYLNALELTFKGLSNPLGGYLKGISIECGTFGSITKDRCSIDWNLSYSKFKTSIYILNKIELREEKFYAKGTSFNNGKINVIKNKSLDINKKNLKENLANAISSLLKAKFSYIYTFENGYLQVIDSKTNSFINSIDEVKENDVFILLKLLDILIAKGKHLGIFLVDCEGISEEVLNCLCILYKEFQKELNVNFLFFFNLDENHKIKTQKIFLPSTF